MLARPCRTHNPQKSTPAPTPNTPPAPNTRNPENPPPHRWRACNAGPYKRKIQPRRKNTLALSLLYSRGEHCSPATTLCCRKAPRVEQSPTPTMHRKRVRKIFIAISQFHRRGGAWLRPGLPNAGSCVSPRTHTEHPRPRRTRNPSIHPRTVGGPAMQTPTSKRQAPRKNTPTLSYYIANPGEHCSPGFAER